MVTELKIVGPLAKEERADVIGMLAKQVTPIPMLPYGVTSQVKSVASME